MTEAPTGRPGADPTASEHRTPASPWQPDIAELLEAIPTALLLVGGDGRILRSNQRANELFGYDPDGLLGLPVDCLLPERLRGGHAAHRAAFSNHPATRPMGTGRELRGVRRDGSEVPVEIGLSPVSTPAGPAVLASIANLTERRRSERALKESERRLSIVFNHVSEAQVLLRVEPDDRLVVVAVNRHYLKTLRAMGFDVEETDLVGKTRDDLLFGFGLPEHLGNEETKAYRRAIAERIPISADVTLPHPLGDLRFEVTIIPVLDDDGRPTHVLWSSRDVTERAQAADALRKSERKYRELMEQAADAIFVTDPAGRYVDANRAACELLGYSVDELHGLTIRDLVPAEDLAGAPLRLPELEAGGTVFSERRLRRKDGALVPVELNARKLSDGNLQAMVRDITERRRVEEERSRLASILEATTDLVGMADAEGRTLYINPAGCRLLGLLEGASPVGRPIADFHPDWARDIVLGQALSAAARDGSWSGETALLSADGREIPVSQLILAHRDESGVLRRVSTVARDITDIKKAQSHLEESLREKEVLLKEIHHRVKNNLQVVSSLLRLQAAKIADPATRQALLESQDRVHSMALIHERLYQSCDLARVDFSEYVESLVESLRRAHATGAVSLRLDLTPVTLTIELAVPSGLILNELVSNAFKHAFPDGRPGEVRVGLERESPDRLAVWVRDDGVGLPEGLSTDNPGTLGLTIVSTLVRQLGGSLEVRRNGGMEFRLAFPVGDLPKGPR